MLLFYNIKELLKNYIDQPLPNHIKSFCFPLTLYTLLFTSAPKYTFSEPDTRYII